VRGLKKYSSGQRRATGRRAGQVGVSYAAALANNAHDHSVKGNFTWRF
jgi:hypothetical protein